MMEESRILFYAYLKDKLSELNTLIRNIMNVTLFNLINFILETPHYEYKLV
jgi:hypothetical protein